MFVARISGRLLIGVWFALAAAQGVAEQSNVSAIEEAKATIWAKELAIYDGRSRGDLGPYLNSASDQYVGWPPGAKLPADLSRLRQMADSVRGQNQEQLTMELADFTLSGDTAVIYFHTHRTRLPSGEQVNQRFAICHVWDFKREMSGSSLEPWAD